MRVVLARGLPGMALGSLLAGCILNLDGLTGGSTTTSSGDGGASPSEVGCPVFDCACASEPRVLATGATFAAQPLGIVVAADGLYWVNVEGGNVVRLSDRGGPPVVLAEASSPRALALAGHRLVWTATDGIYTCGVPECTDATRVTPSLAVGSLQAVVFDGQRLVFTDRGVSPGDGRARFCTLAGCAPLDLGESLLAPAGVALEGTMAYWVDQGNGNANGAVQRASASSQGLAQVAAALNWPQAIAVDESHVYWTQHTAPGHVVRCSRAGGYCDTPEDIAPAAGGLGAPGDLRIAAGRIYWTNTEDGTILSCPQPGCGTAKPKVHATGRSGLGQLAVGASCLYWTESGGGGAVLKVAR